MSRPPSINNLSNGLAVIVQEIPQVESVAFSLSIPSGILVDSPEHIGSSLILAELTSRGAGPYDSRSLSEEFENFGIRHSESAGMESIGYSATFLSEQLDPALRLVSLMVQEASLPSDEIENIKSLLIQEIDSMYDNPGRRVMHELRKRYYPGPFNRSLLGERDGIQSCSRDILEKDYHSRFTPRGSVLSVAGKVKADQVVRSIEKHFGAWSGEEISSPRCERINPYATYHVELDSAQLQIALGYRSAKFLDPDYYAARVMNAILSGGMFGRLFIEVREKRGLCYSVYSSHSASRDEGGMIAYAGTTPDRAQETLDVLVKELRRVSGTVTDEELNRAKANLKAGLVMSQESSGARAFSNASDWWWAKRVRTLEEIESGINAVTAASIDHHLKLHPPQDMTMVTLGGKSLKFPER